MPDAEPRITKLLNRHQNDVLNLDRIYRGAELEDQRRLLNKILTVECVYEQGGFRYIELGHPFNLILRQDSA